MKKTFTTFYYRYQFPTSIFFIGMLALCIDLIAILLGKDVPLKLVADGITYSCAIIGAFILAPHINIKQNSNSWKEIFTQMGLILLYIGIISIIFFVSRISLGL